MASICRTSRVTLTPSGMSAVMLIAQAMVGQGDNAVAVTPSWPNILRAMQICGAEPREVAMTAGNDGWSLDMEALFAACDGRTKVIYLASPGNPTGWMIPPCSGGTAAGICSRPWHRDCFGRGLPPSGL